MKTKLTILFLTLAATFAATAQPIIPYGKTSSPTGLDMLAVRTNADGNLITVRVPAAALGFGKIGFITKTSLRLPTTTNPGLTTWMQRTLCVSAVPTTNLALLFSGFLIPGEIASAGGSNTQVAASIEYPAGNFTPVLFSGNTYGIIVNGSFLTSDFVTLSTPIPQGATYWIRSYCTNTTGCSFWQTSANGNIYGTTREYGTTVTNSTLSSTWTGVSTVSSCAPFAVIGPNKNRSVLIIGDSRDVGSHSDIDGPDVGIDKLVGRYYGYADLGIGGEYVTDTNIALRASFQKYATDFLSDMGYNGISMSVSNDVSKLAAFFGIPVTWETITPSSTSSDNWSTISGQSHDSSFAGATNFNTLLRAGHVDGVSGVLDISSVNESSLNSGFWQVNGVTNWLTADGIHGNYYNRAMAMLGNPFESSSKLPATGGTISGPITAQTISTQTGFFSSATNRIVVTTTGCTNLTGFIYDCAITGTSMTVKDDKGGTIASGLSTWYLPLKPNWALTGSGVAGYTMQH
jgi:hypothetical protein